MNVSFVRVAFATALCCALPYPVHAKPISFADGTTVMGEYGAGTMIEVQAFYAPTFRYSLGGSHLALNSDEDDRTREITYLRSNYLPKRWNFESAQANVFVWGSLGHGERKRELEQRVRLECRWPVRLRDASDLCVTAYAICTRPADYSHRIDTLQLGIAPYKHDYQTLAVWFVLQARQYTGGLYEGTEWAALIRLFKRNAWVEAGPTQDGKLQAMLMFNF